MTMHRGLWAALLLASAALACAKPAPKTIEELRAAKRDVSLSLVGEVVSHEVYSSHLYSYESAGLKLHALVARPSSPMPEGGYPVLVANHGHHPDPPEYGITAEGQDLRPGDYYRPVQELFLQKGFVVVSPDYRGHNNSEGFEFTEGMLESSYYSEDVLNLLAGLSDIEDINHDKVFMWGHSMGGEVTLRALLATERIRGASMWSSVGGDIWDQSYYYSRYEDPAAPDSSEKDKYVISRLQGRIADLDESFDSESVEPLNHLAALTTPLIIHHGIGDRGAAYKWSEQLAKELYMQGKTYEFWSYPGDHHLFSGEELQLAVDRDVSFFISLSE